MKTINDNIKSILALIITVCTFGYFFACELRDETPNDQIIIAVVGFMSGIIGYYFGTTVGSSKKDETIQLLTNKNEKENEQHK